MAPKTLLYDETAKRVYKTDREDQNLQEFTDNALTGKDGKRAKVKNKGILNNTICSHIFEYLEGYNIPTYYLEKVSDREMLVRSCDNLPLEVVVRNLAAGSFCRRYDVEEGLNLKYPVIEYFLKNSSLNDPLVSESYMSAFGHATPEEMKHVTRLAAKINAVLKDYFERRSIKLVDLKIEFGRTQNQVLLSSEISPENSTLWDINDAEKFDKQHFGLRSGKAESVFKDLHDRILGS